MNILTRIWRYLTGPLLPMEDRVEEALRRFDRERLTGEAYLMDREES